MSEIYSGKTDNEGFENLQNVGNDYLSPEVLKAYSRAFKSEVSKKAAMLVLETLDAKKREFLRLKYGEKKQLVAISFMLDKSISQLMQWNKKIVAKIANFVTYRLTTEDIFRKREIAGMIELLLKTIEFFSVLSREYKEVRQDWLNDLKRRKNNYQKLLSKIERMETEGEQTTFKEVLAVKVQNPHWSSQDIARKCRLERSVVSRYLQRFTDLAGDYLK